MCDEVVGGLTVSWVAAREERQMKRMVLVETILGGILRRDCFYFVCVNLACC